MKRFSLLLLLLISCFSPSCVNSSNAERVRETFVQANGAQIFCRVAGKGDPIVIIHGGPGLTQDYLVPQMMKLAKTNLVIFYDQRACGLSTGEINPDSIQIATFIEDLECVRKAFALKKMTVLGHSWGGFLAMKYAIAYPDSVDKLILANTLPSSSEDISLFINEWMLRMAPHQDELKAITDTKGFADGDPSTIEHYYRVVFRTYCYQPKKADLLNLHITPKASIDGFKVYGIFQKNVFMQTFDFHDQLKSLRMPTLVIHGDVDPIPLATAKSIHESIPGSSYVVLKDCGHFPYVERPDEFFQHLDTFLHQEIKK